jgi:predicted component of type VI protein secretion system
VLLAPDQRVDVAESIKRDMTAFLSAMATEEALSLKDFGVPSTLEDVLASLRNIYQLEA